MFAANAIDELAKEHQGEKYELRRGLWSLLFTPTPEDDRRFFDLYADHLDKTVGPLWHCVGFLRCEWVEDAGGKERRRWVSDQAMHDVSDGARALVKGETISEREAAMVFFNPLSTLAESKACVVRLDFSRLHEKDHFEKGLGHVTRCVSGTVQRDPDYRNVDEFHIDERLRRLDACLSNSLLKRLGLATLGVAVPALMKLFLDQGAKAVGLKP